MYCPLVVANETFGVNLTIQAIHVILHFFSLP
jgi:hypothetical protein